MDGTASVAVFSVLAIFSVDEISVLENLLQQWNHSNTEIS